MDRHKKLKKVIEIAAIISIPIILLSIDWFIYPFQTKHPNFSDVNRVFNKMTFPSDWKVVSTSENKGTAGRTCPIESESKCFHKGVIYQIPVNTDQKTIEAILRLTGCPSPIFTDNKPVGSYPYTNFQCSIDATTVDGGIKKISNNYWELSVYVST